MTEESEYVTNLISINKNLRDQIEKLHKVLKMKLKIENNTRLDSYLNELEILRSSLSFTLQKHNNLFNKMSIIDNTQLIYKLKELERINENINKDNILIKEHLNLLEINNHNLRVELEGCKNDFLTSDREKSELIKQIEEEKIKNRNFVNLIRELEKRKGNDGDSNKLKQQIEFLTNKLNDLELRTKSKLEQKDLIIKKLDSKLLEYESRIL
jgi:hypothetical protein